MRILFASAIAAAAVAATASGSPLPTAKSCPLFPADNAWNRRVDTLPVAAGSDATVAAIGTTKTMHADFGSGLWDGGPIGIPITVVGRAQPRSTVRFDYADESDRGPYPIPAAVKIEGGTERRRRPARPHRRSRRLPPLRALCAAAGRRLLDGGIGRDLGPALEPAASCGLDIRRRGRPADPARTRALRRGREGSHRSRAALHGVADTTGIRLAGAALRELAHRSSAAADGRPAAVEAQTSTSPASRARRAIVLQALKEYGMIVADNGSDWFVSGAPDPRWSNDDLHTLGRVPGSAFEVVDTSTLRH